MKNFEIPAEKPKDDINKPGENDISVKTKFLADMTLDDIAKSFTKFAEEERITVIPIGFPQAGKSFLISSLMYYARMGKDTLFKTDLKINFPFDKGKLAAEEMIAKFKEGAIYATTRKGTLDLIGIDIEPHKKLPILKLAFLDLAGEDVKKIKTTEGGEFTEKINAVFNGLKFDNSKIIFTLITPFDPAKKTDNPNEDPHNEEDTLHINFLNYIKETHPDMLKNSTFFIVVSQWDNNKNEKLTVEEFIEKNRRSIWNYVKHSNVVWGEYSVGKFLVTPSEKKVTLLRINHHYPYNFWKQLYYICTGKRLDLKTWWEKLLG